MAVIKTAIQITDGFSPAFKSMNNALGVVMSSLASTQKALGKPIDLTAVNQAQQDLARAASELDRVGQEAQQAANGQDKFNKSMKEGGSAANALWGKLKGVIGAYASWQGIKTLISGADTFTNINSRIDLMNDGLRTTEELSNAVWESANRTFSSFKDTADAVGKLGIQAADAFSNSQDVVNFAEQLNKHIKIAGTEGAAAQGAMIQMVQAMSNGVLRGEELNSVMDGMPTVAKTIEKYMKNLYKGDAKFGTYGLKDFAEEGMLTANIVKTALYEAADETNKKFQDMGITFADTWTIFKNHADKALRPVYKELGKISNSKGFQTFAEVAGGAFAAVGWAVTGVLNVVSGLFSFIKQNATWITPILGAVAAGFIAQGVAALWAKREILLNAAVVAWKAVCDWAATAAIIAMEFAQNGLNAALAMCPLSWIIGLIIALIAVFYLAVAAVNHFAGTSISATGLIAGAFAGLGSFIYNQVMYLWNTFSIFAEFLINVLKHPIYSIKALFLNFGISFLDNVASLTKGWDKFATSFANAFLTAINWVLEGWNKLIDAMPDVIKDKLGLAKANKLEMSTSITSDITDLRDKMAASLEKDKPEDYVTLKRAEYMDVGKNALGAYDWGATLTDKLTSALDPTKIAEELGSKQMLENASKNPADGYGSALKKLADNAAKTAKNTGKTADALTASDDDLEFMRALGEREAINKFTTAEIKLNVSNQNTVNSALDLDGIVSALTNKLREAMSIAAEGSHA